jgi:rRNA maturation RNase YbeY
MPFRFFAEDIKMPDIDNESIANWLSYVVEEEGFQEGEFNIIMCSDEYLIEMNKKYLNHDFFTDIITFDYREDFTLAGELFISFDRIKDNAEKYADNQNQEIYRVIVHGLLHICGYNDHSKSEKIEMREKENFYLEKIGKL